MSDEDATDDLEHWYVDVAEALGEKSPDAIGRELPGLVDIVTEERDIDYYVVGASFTKGNACFDYAVDAVTVPDDGEPTTETVKPPTSESHRYVQFTHPPDPHFDASALRARLVATIDNDRWEAAEPDEVRPGLAGLWEAL